MWPITARSGPSAVPLTRATVEPTLSWLMSANAAAASRKTAAAACSYPDGPGAVSSLRRTSGTGIGSGSLAGVKRDRPCSGPLQQLPQHEREDAAVPVVLDLLGGV